MRIINARTVTGSYFSFGVENGVFTEVTPASGPIDVLTAQPLTALVDAGSARRTTFDAAGSTILPAGVDAHVHSRDPGLTAKEDWHTLARGAYRGGVTAVADMPNTLPPTMNRDAVLAKSALAHEAGLTAKVLLGVGKGNIDQVAALLSDPGLPICALKVFYGRTTGELMYDDLETLGRSLPADGKKPIVFHSEDQCMVDCNHDKFADRTHAKDNVAFRIHSEIRSSTTAHASTRTILTWAEQSYRRPIHIAHVSTPLEVELVGEAKSRGVPVTCEVAPHHLLLSTDDYERLGPLAKMNPPLRSPQEVEALQRLVGEGHVDLFATDHAPHLLKEKYVDVARSPSGVPSLEFFYPLLFEVARRIPRLGLERMVKMASEVPAALFGFTGRGRIADGFNADFVWIGEAAFQARNADVVSKCGWTPYDGWELPRDVLATWASGRRVYDAQAARARTQTNG